MGRRGSRFLAAIPSRVWERTRRRILDRDNYRCRKCGRPGRLEVHHVTPLHRGGAPLDPANLLTLCHGCHIREHSREKERDPERQRWRDYLRDMVIIC